MLHPIRMVPLQEALLEPRAVPLQFRKAIALLAEALRMAIRQAALLRQRSDLLMQARLAGQTQAEKETLRPSLVFPMQQERRFRMETAAERPAELKQTSQKLSKEAAQMETQPRPMKERRTCLLKQQEGWRQGEIQRSAPPELLAVLEPVLRMEILQQNQTETQRRQQEQRRARLQQGVGQRSELLELVAQVLRMLVLPQVLPLSKISAQKSVPPPIQTEKKAELPLLLRVSDQRAALSGRRSMACHQESSLGQTQELQAKDFQKEPVQKMLLSQLQSESPAMWALELLPLFVVLLRARLALEQELELVLVVLLASELKLLKKKLVLVLLAFLLSSKASLELELELQKSVRVQWTEVLLALAWVLEEPTRVRLMALALEPVELAAVLARGQQMVLALELEASQE